MENFFFGGRGKVPPGQTGNLLAISPRRSKDHAMLA
jgi:hypothetical protein